MSRILSSCRPPFYPSFFQLSCLPFGVGTSPSLMPSQIVALVSGFQATVLPINIFSSWVVSPRPTSLQIRQIAPSNFCPRALPSSLRISASRRPQSNDTYFTVSFWPHSHRSVSSALITCRYDWSFAFARLSFGLKDSCLGACEMVSYIRFLVWFPERVLSQVPGVVSPFCPMLFPGFAHYLESARRCVHGWQKRSCLPASRYISAFAFFVALLHLAVSWDRVELKPRPVRHL